MTITLIILTAIASIIVFKQHFLFYKYGLIPYKIIREHSYYRFLTSGFLHANWGHLIINMFVLWSFGTQVEQYFSVLFQNSIVGKIVFLAFYLSAIPIASVASFIKQRNNPDYLAIGASGAVSAIVFCSIIFNPLSKLMILPIPIPIPAVIFGFLYLLYSWYMGKRGGDNIGHDAHFWGAIYGIIVPIIIKPSLAERFINIIFNALGVN